MKKFRVLSDLHLDVNEKYPFELEDNQIFTVICGDTSGEPPMTIEWIKNNCPNGVGVSGNHLPYNDFGKTLQELREDLANEFPASGTFTYLDCETGTFSKVVDGIMFIGTCMYSDMHITHPTWNPTGNKDINERASLSHMNDYRYGITKKEFPHGIDNDPKITRLVPEDYFFWFKNAYDKIDKLLDENESSDNPLPVVLITHYSLLSDFIEHNSYIDEAYSPRTYNWPSYASEHKKWLKRHKSIKCYCCGHIHAVDAEYRSFKIPRDDGSQILVVNNARGYLREFHDSNFNKNRFVNVETWELEEDPIPKDECIQKEKRSQEMLARLSLFGW